MTPCSYYDCLEPATVGDLCSEHALQQAEGKVLTPAVPAEEPRGAHLPVLPIGDGEADRMRRLEDENFQLRERVENLKSQLERVQRELIVERQKRVPRKRGSEWFDE